MRICFGFKANTNACLDPLPRYECHYSRVLRLIEKGNRGKSQRLAVKREKNHLFECKQKPQFIREIRCGCWAKVFEYLHGLISEECRAPAR